MRHNARSKTTRQHRPECRLPTKSELLGPHSRNRRMLEQLRAWARALKRDMLAVWLAPRDPRVPWYVKGLGLAVAAYALSPIDLIPDFIPILGYIDDLLIVPLGLLLVIRLLSPQVLADSREKAAAVVSRPGSYAAAAFVVAVWLLCVVAQRTCGIRRRE